MPVGNPVISGSVPSVHNQGYVRLEANGAAIRKAARSGRHAANQACKAQTLEARLAKPARVAPTSDAARIEALHAGETVWVRDAYNLVSAEMRMDDDRIDVGYSVVGHNKRSRGASGIPSAWR